ncbi:FMN-binding glutamate synthase family protein [Altericroceibacterium endophyticum]|uniref:FMN-binding glutamate synthase family protein n=1 Tax=Altericroceibacterium endophyticum TaxID=1808508 RepID=A0A6I4T7R9_9SPHN|nr:FMN-binding glutamate synthase family protein [Altericroceibacterium endophyticum]MXO67006.1 FMN-binding glutamate synthase family protein [Altericroceibacterium endophyticum]
MLVRGLFADKGWERNLGLWIPLGLLAAIVLLGVLVSHHFFWGLLLIVPLLLIALWDLAQTTHSLRRNYPLTSRFRWLFEDLRPFLRSYIVEGPLEGRPFDRVARSLVYARAKKQEDAHPFGTELDVYSNEYEALCHSTAPNANAPKRTRVTVGTDQCSKPYDAARLNISAMSFGALGSHAIEALNMGAKLGNFYHDTGEGGLSPYHLKHGGDVVWEIGSGYFGARDDNGNFDPESFRDKSQHDQVKMTEIKLSQGAKPGHGGLLPAAKVTVEIANTRQVQANKDCLSPPGHSAFSTPREMLEFAAKMRELSGGKPVGIKLCVGMPHEVFAICKAMLDSGITLDFIVVDGGGGGTGAAPLELSDHVGLPLRIGLYYVNNALIGTGLKDKVKLAASEKVFSGSAIAMNAALGANWCNAARAFMFSLGCVQSLRCHTGTCPTGVATSSPARQRGLVIPEKAERVANFQSKTLDSLHDIVVACGLETPDDFTPRHLRQWKNNAEMIPWSQIVHEVEPGKLLHEPDDTAFAEYWRMANPDTFKPTL